ncbi:hypothetical protein [Nocardia veterana]|uniref:Uncharacterized protein n=1 Tax=Nocardia veterana TaxID=132249 RepID=A0A7X6M0F2_9NOCA|nr:hypothetical protein [Nocardia veterana]NKY87917.1 hypothetical protein [Nocardia veterana]
MGSIRPIRLTWLTHTELVQAISTLELRIHLADDHSTIYGPAPSITNAGDSTDTAWLEDELTELEAELTPRRSHT